MRLFLFELTFKNINSFSKIQYYTTYKLHITTHIIPTCQI